MEKSCLFYQKQSRNNAEDKSLNTDIPTFPGARYWHSRERKKDKYLTVRNREIFPTEWLTIYVRAFCRVSALNLQYSYLILRGCFRWHTHTYFNCFLPYRFIVWFYFIASLNGNIKYKLSSFVETHLDRINILICYEILLWYYCTIQKTLTGIPFLPSNVSPTTTTSKYLNFQIHLTQLKVAYSSPFIISFIYFCASRRYDLSRQGKRRFVFAAPAKILIVIVRVPPVVCFRYTGTTH